MNSLNVSVVVEPTHPMSSSNTKDKNIFRLANGNYISRMAYVYMVADKGLIKMSEVVDLVNKYGFPIVMAVGMGYIIKYVWEWATKEVKPVINDANSVLIALIDRIRMLDNDLIRLNQKVNTVLHLRGKMIESDRVMETQKVEAAANAKFHEAMDEVDKTAVDNKKSAGAGGSN